MAIYTKGNRVYEVMENYDGTYGTHFYPINIDKNEHPEYIEHCSTVTHEATIEAAQERLDEYARKQGFEIYSEEPEDGFPLEDKYSEEDIEELTENAEDDTMVEDENDGDLFSLRLPIFETIINSTDAVIRDLANNLKSKYIESGEVVVHILLDNYGGSIKLNPKSFVTGDVKPTKVKSILRIPSDTVMEFDQRGRLIIPDDRQHQMRFEETKGFTVTTDSSGVVESVDMDQDVPFPETTYKCDVIDCPLYTGFNGTDNGCSFCGNVNAPLDDDTKGSIHEAVTVHNCQRNCILEICGREFPAENEPDFIEPSFNGDCDNFMCNFCDDYKCHFDITRKNYGALYGYPVNEDDIISTFEECERTNPQLEKEYRKIKSDVEGANKND